MSDTPRPASDEVLPCSLQYLEVLIGVIRPELVDHSCHQILLFCKVLQPGIKQVKPWYIVKCACAYLGNAKYAHLSSANAVLLPDSALLRDPNPSRGDS